MSMVESKAVQEAAALLSGRRVALVHDWVNGFRGGEKVLEALCEIAPEADLFTLFYVPGSASPRIESRRIRASWMNRLPRVHSYYRWLLPLFPNWADRLDLSAYDVVLSTSHCVAKGVRARPGAPHFCYCHTPMRYVWDRFEDYFGHHRGPVRWFIEAQARRLRAWDRDTAGRVDAWMANSHFVRRRILDFYGPAGVEASAVRVVHPPVDVERFASAPAAPGGEQPYLVVSALVPYKRIEVAVRACARTGRRLDVAGTGPELARLKALSTEGGERIRFLGFVPDAELPDLMASRRALLFPGVEDFGITPVEATAAGLPVVAQARGGALDTVEDGRNGVLYEGDDATALAAALDRFEAVREGWDRPTMVSWARRFSTERFHREVGALLREGLGDGVGPDSTERSGSW